MPARLMRPLHLLMTADAVGGIWQYALDLLGGLSRHGITSTLAMLGPPPSSEQRSAARAIPGLTLLETGLPLDWLAEQPVEICRAGQRIAELADSVRADVVHLNAAALAAEARFLAPVVVTHHSCVASWWHAVCGGQPMPREFEWQTELVARGLHRADRVIAPTRAFAAAVAGCYALQRDLSIVHNGRASPLVAGAGRSVAPAVFTAGRLWDAGKNLGVLDRAARRLDLPVLAAGPITGPNGSSIELRHIKVLGNLQETALRGHLAARPIYASTAVYEPFGLAVLEAAQAGCALVLSDIAGFRELWDGAAIFVPPRDEAAVALAIAELARSPARRAGLGRRARMRSKRYGAGAMVQATLEVYRALLGHARARANLGVAA
jgi:glycosyltransferase involved in cell wall biosynthesis